ncbi:MAG: esterase/lipase family protein [Pseudonocardia sp.]
MSRRVVGAALAVVLLAALAVVGLRSLDGGPIATPTGTPLLRPAQDLPGPVLLIPGYGGSRRALLELAQRIERTGRDARVLRLDGDGTGDLAAQVAVLDAAVDAALAGGAPSVDVVGYSAGGVVAGLWVARADGGGKARRVVTLGAPLGGTTLAGFAATFRPQECPAACRQLAPDSPLLAELARARVGQEVPWLSVWTVDDETVTPPETARLDGAVNVAVQQVCPGARVGDGGLPIDRAVVGLVLDALSTGPITSDADCARLRAAGAR